MGKGSDFSLQFLRESPRHTLAAKDVVKEWTDMLKYVFLWQLVGSWLFSTIPQNMAVLSAHTKGLE